MEGIPTKVLSDHLAALLSDRRVTAAVFLTYQFEPKFFEDEVLSLFLASGSQNPKLRLIELETALHEDIGPVAVYYDPRAFEPDGASRMDFRKIPISSVQGVFHPKVALVLTEPRDSTDSKSRPSLIFSIMSGNLTKSGWWSNLECAHTEELSEGQRCSYRKDLLKLLTDVRALGGEPRDHDALNQVLNFARGKLDDVSHATLEGRLRPRLIGGTAPLIKFLQETHGSSLYGKSLEIISPFFDATDPHALKDLIDAFAPREVRVFLPRNAEREALCSAEIYEGIKALPNTSWASLPEGLLKLGKDKKLKRRFVHAKVYRFTEKTSKFEALLIGSHNLTQPAHQRGGNFEASVLIEPEIEGALDWWLTKEERRPSGFAPDKVEETDDMEDTEASIPLEIRFDWKKRAGKIRWNGETPPLSLVILSAGVELFQFASLASKSWRNLPALANQALADSLLSSGILTVNLPDGRSDDILVQEDAMLRKPSILITLTVAEILEYWSHLTPEQKSSFLESRFGEKKDIPETLREKLKAKGVYDGSMFDRFAGIFHGFQMLRHQVWKTLEGDNLIHAEYLLLGQRHDSLPCLVQRIFNNEDNQDPIHRYLVLLCARQLLGELKKGQPDFYSQHVDELEVLRTQICNTIEIRSQLELGPEGGRFLNWFEGHFLRRAVPLVSTIDE